MKISPKDNPTLARWIREGYKCDPPGHIEIPGDRYQRLLLESRSSHPLYNDEQREAWVAINCWQPAKVQKPKPVQAMNCKGESCKFHEQDFPSCEAQECRFEKTTCRFPEQMPDKIEVLPCQFQSPPKNVFDTTLEWAFKLAVIGLLILIASQSARAQRGTSFIDCIDFLESTGDIVAGAHFCRPFKVKEGNNISFTRSGGTITISASLSGSGIVSLGGQTGDTQLFATGTTGNDFNISSSGDTHTFNFPSASATKRGLLSSADWTTFNNKAASNASTTVNGETCALGGSCTVTSSVDETASYTWTGTHDYTGGILEVPQKASPDTALGRISVDTDNSKIYVGDGAAADELLKAEDSVDVSSVSANEVLAGPASGGAAAAAFRALVAADIGNGIVGDSALAAGAVDGGTGGEIADESITSADIDDGSLLPADLDVDADTPGDEECLTYESTGTDFEWQSCGSGSLTVEEEDGNPSVASVTTIKVTNGTLTDNTGGSVSISTGGGGDSTKTHYLPLNCSTPRSATLAGNSFWTVGARTNFDNGHWEFAKDVEGKIYCNVLVPNTLAGTPAAAIVLELAANATSGVTSMVVSTAYIADGESLNGSFTAETLQDVTVPGTAYLTKRVTFSLTNGGAPVALDHMFVEIFHDGDQANDTLAVNTELIGAWLKVDLTE